jgi:hypothetical protein
MHAVLVHVKISDYESARKGLLADVIPMVKQSPGFQSGVWLAPTDGAGTSIVVFDTEANATQAAEMVRSGGPQPESVELVSVEVREVAGQA